ncbi:hypothetical protein O6H91_01G011700 [Diphasiastrum complanatum]|uniref:Uncharacterized protein n=1 Tax=Diphasiastrum complanatum TaxID=34168 RepID=A0ACC2ENC7_DIPCM|nr:hypothetical protein O6H91_Y080000 [Diphasiastrum complanatum]KAJ7567910.1 hypothetical protein O6H91_01G011700 [Diphasiastrum complanatum]
MRQHGTRYGFPAKAVEWKCQVLWMKLIWMPCFAAVRCCFELEVADWINGSVMKKGIALFPCVQQWAAAAVEL